MEVKVLSKLNANKVLTTSNDAQFISITENIRSGETARGIVLQKFPNGNDYLLSIFGKQVRFNSEAKLLIGETLDLKINKVGTRIELEIYARSNGSKGFDSIENYNGWTKNYFSPSKTIQQAIEPMNTEIAVHKIIQFLDVYFPGIEWRIDTPYLNWHFEDGEADGYYGKAKNSYSFYFHFQSKNLGVIDSYFYSKKEDFSDFILHSVFDNLSVYFLANENLSELKKMLSSNSISANDIIFHYSTFDIKKGDWIA